MSPLWRDEVSIFCAPRKLALQRRARALRPVVTAATDVVVPGGQAGNFAPALARLAELLAEPTWQHARVRIVVADPWARYALVPWPDTRLDAAARLTHARHLLGDAFGEALADWGVTLADTPPGAAGVACAMPAALLASLEELLAEAQLRLVSLQPQLVVAFNAWRHRLPADDAWFVSLDDGSLTAVHLAGGGWDRVHSARLSSDWGLELARLQAFGRLLQSAGGVGRMYIDAPLWMRRSAPLPGPELEWLEGDRDGDDPEPHELALLQRMYA